MWRFKFTMWSTNQPFQSKRFVTVFIILMGLFTLFFYRAGQILHYRIELSRVRFLYRACQEKLNTMKNFSESKKKPEINNLVNTSALQSLLDQMSGMKAATGFEELKPLSYEFFLPHLKQEPHRLLPSYHMKSDRELVDIVIGVANVKRDKEFYLLNTMKDLVNGIGKEEINSILIIVLIAEPDLEYVLNTTWTLEKEFPFYVKSGLIQVISPSTSYYPNLDSLPSTLGDSPKRVKWRSKQVLDVMYLMAYGHTKGSYYLMMEDDVSAVENYIKGMKTYISFCTTMAPQWVLIEFSHYFGSLGKVFKTSDVGHFLTYMQLFYYNMPLDFLIESYLKNRVCDVTKTLGDCNEALLKIRKIYPRPMFLHVGLYSSLPGKIGKVQNPKFAKGRQFFPHVNPPLKRIWSDVQELPFHSLFKAYNGHGLFIGTNPKSGDLIEFWFKKPTALKSYKFQSGNFERKHDTFVQTDVEVYPVNLGNFTKVGSFDEFGYAKGDLEHFGPLEGIRLRVINVTRELRKNVVLSEIRILQCNSILRATAS